MADGTLYASRSPNTWPEYPPMTNITLPFATTAVWPNLPFAGIPFVEILPNKNENQEKFHESVVPK